MEPEGPDSFASEVIVARIVDYSRIVASMTSIEPRRKPVPAPTGDKPEDTSTHKRPRRRPVAETSYTITIGDSKLMPLPEEGPSTQTATLIFPSTSKSTAIHVTPEITGPTLAITRVNLQMRRAMSLPPYGPGPTEMYALPSLRMTATPVQGEASLSLPFAPGLHRSGAVHRRRLGGSRRRKTQSNILRNVPSRTATPSIRQPAAPMRAKTRRFTFVDWFDQRFELVSRPSPSRSKTMQVTPTRRMTMRPRRGDSSIRKTVSKAWGQVSQLGSSFGNVVVSKIRGPKITAGTTQIKSDPPNTTVWTPTVPESNPQYGVTKGGLVL